MPTCCAILLTGDREGLKCTKNVRGDATRCGIHKPLFDRNPHNVAIRELHAYQAKKIRIVEDGVREAGLPLRIVFTYSHIIDAWIMDRRTAVAHLADDVIATMSFPYGEPVPENIRDVDNVRNIEAPVRAEIMVMNEDGEIEVFDVEVPPPLPVNPIPLPRARRRRGRNAADVPAVPLPPAPPAPRRNAARVPPRPLAAFAADKQNIHTTQSVNMTKEVVERVMKVAVPVEYRWNMNTVSKTVGEIIAECNLTSEEMVEMMNRYIRDDDVYDMGKGIYGKVLDGVWQCIRNSPDKADMCRILKQELKDNIGMCAQGNLTRLCNVLAGYMDGIGPQESIGERLGRELPLLMDDEDRITKAKTLMQSLNVPEAEWAPWLEALA